MISPKHTVDCDSQVCILNLLLQGDLGKLFNPSPSTSYI